MVSYFCEVCSQFWDGAPIQARNHDGGVFKDLCFECMVKALNKMRQDIREERKKRRGRRVDYY